MSLRSSRERQPRAQDTRIRPFQQWRSARQKTSEEVRSMKSGRVRGGWGGFPKEVTFDHRFE